MPFLSLLCPAASPAVTPWMNAVRNLPTRLPCTSRDSRPMARVVPKRLGQLRLFRVTVAA
jgi:hypothetical protein